MELASARRSGTGISPADGVQLQQEARLRAGARGGAEVDGGTQVWHGHLAREWRSAAAGGTTPSRGHAVAPRAKACGTQRERGGVVRFVRPSERPIESISVRVQYVHCLSVSDIWHPDVAIEQVDTWSS